MGKMGKINVPLRHPGIKTHSSESFVHRAHDTQETAESKSTRDESSIRKSRDCQSKSTVQPEGRPLVLETLRLPRYSGVFLPSSLLHFRWLPRAAQQEAGKMKGAPATTRHHGQTARLNTYAPRLRLLQESARAVYVASRG